MEPSDEYVLDTLESLLKTHDWYYEYSDDHRAWKKGAEERREITRMMKIAETIGLGIEAGLLWESYQPKHN